MIGTIGELLILLSFAACGVSAAAFFFSAQSEAHPSVAERWKRTGRWAWAAMATGLVGAMRGPIAPGATQEGTASYYADKFVGRPTASGEPYAHDSLTAAHRSLPFGTVVRVRRLDTGEAVVVRINDRGPFKRGRIIDLSREAARQIDLLQVGIADVRLTILSLPDGPSVAPSSPTGPTW